MSGVVALNSGFVAGGVDRAGGDADAAVWTSPDGSRWERVAHDEPALGGAGAQEIRGVAASDRMLIAVGSTSAGEDTDAAIWMSVDGISWTRIDPDEADLGGDGREEIWSVTSDGPGWVAVGSDWSGGDADAAVWTSPDGYGWTRISHDEEVLGGPGRQEMLAVVAGEFGVIAVGYDSNGGANGTNAAVWIASDGQGWSRVLHDELVFGGPDLQVMNGVAMGGPGVVAVGSDASGLDGDAAVWTTPNGRSWTRASGDTAGLVVARPQAMWAVAAGNAGLVAVGFESAGSVSFAAVWTSDDGHVWSRVPHDPAVFGPSDSQAIWSVANGAGGFVGVGWEWLADQNAAVWVARE